MKVGAVIIAMGMGSSQEEIKLFLEDEHPNIFEEIVWNYQRAGIKELIVLVDKKNADEIEDTLLHKGVTFLKVSKSKTEVVLSEGLQYLRDQCDRIVLGTMEYPFFRPEVIETLTGSSEDIAGILHDGKKSGIFGLSRTGVQEICRQLEQNSDQNGKPWNGIAVFTEVEDESAVIQVKTLEEYRSYKEKYGRKKMHGFVKVGLAVNRSFFGPGIVTLLKEIDRFGSVRKACIHMGMSYSKGWKLIHVAEEESGWMLVRRTTGGTNGGEAHLTEQCKRLIEKYEQYVSRVQEEAKIIYDEIFESKEMLEERGEQNADFQ